MNSNSEIDCLPHNRISKLIVEAWPPEKEADSNISTSCPNFESLYPVVKPVIPAPIIQIFIDF